MELRLHYHPEIEQSLLGCCIVHGISLPVGVEAFYERRNQLIARTILELDEAGIPVDLIAVVDRMRESKRLSDVGGASYVAGLMNIAALPENLDVHASKLRESACVRALKTTCAKIAVSGPDMDPQDACASLQSVLDTFSGGATSEESIIETTKRVISDIEYRHRVKGLLGVPTGLVDLDRRTSGLCPSDLIIVAARPGMGKTAFALQCAAHNAADGRHVMIFSLEMSREQLVTRLLVRLSDTDLLRTRSGRLTDRELAAVIRESKQLSHMPITIDDTSSPTIHDIRYRARRVKPDLVIIDYLQLIASSERSERRDIEISRITRSAKQMAREMHVPVMMLSQLNRKVEERSDRRPIMADLRDSGAIEQDADVIIFLYRDEVYNPGSKDRGIAEVLLGKQRNGPSGGRIRVAWRSHSATFHNLSDIDREG